MDAHLRKGRHSVTRLVIHLVCVTKYRRKVFDDAALAWLQTHFDKVCRTMGADLLARRVGPIPPRHEWQGFSGVFDEQGFNKRRHIIVRTHVNIERGRVAWYDDIMNQTHEQLTKALTNATHVGVVGSRAPIRRGLCRWLLASGFVLGLALPPVTTQGAISPAAAEQGEALSSAAQRIQPIQQELGSMLAKVDESRDDFVRRVAGRIAAFTYASGHEVCGLIERERDFPHRYRVILRTNRSQVGCLQRPSKDPLFEPTGEGVHSHPLTEWVSLTAQDMRLRSHPQFWCGRSIRVAAAGFSDNDYNNGPGYLVVNDQLLHQAGRGTDRNLGPITITADDQQQMTAMAQQSYGAINCAQFAQARRALGLRVRPR